MLIVWDQPITESKISVIITAATIYNLSSDGSAFSDFSPQVFESPL